MRLERPAEILLVALAMAAWTVYCLFWLVMLQTPAIEGAEEVAIRTRIVIVGGWLAGMTVGAIAIVGLWRGLFDDIPGPLRLRIAAVGVFVAALLVVALYWFELSGVLLFLWAPLAAGVLLLVGWASAPSTRSRLKQSLGLWVLGFAAVLALWFALPPGTLQFHFWTLLGVVSLVSLAWWAWPLLARPGQERT